MSLERWWAGAPPGHRQDLTALVLERIVVNPAERAGSPGVDIAGLEFAWK